MLWFLSDTLWSPFQWGLVCEELAWIRLGSGRRPLCGFRLVSPAGWPSCEPSSRTTMHNIPCNHSQHPCHHTQRPMCSQGTLPGLALHLLAPVQERKGASLGLKKALTSHTHSPGHVHLLRKTEDRRWRLEDAALVVGAGRGGEEPWVCS